MTLIGGLLIVLPVWVSLLLLLKATKGESVVAMKTGESPDEKFTRQGGKAQTGLCDTGWYPKPLLQKFMQSGWSHRTVKGFS